MSETRGSHAGAPGGFSRDETRWMRRALALAVQGFTPPNPQVGCVLVKDGVIVGEGFHPYAGGPHAEAAALRAAGDAARGSTAYVTLEPCSHQGRTPPCTVALIQSGVHRVVAAVRDPNPSVSGGGLDALSAAGIEVGVGLLEEEAAYVNAPFFHFHRTGMPFVALKAAMTLDGKIATRTGDSKWITGEKSRALVHRLRAQCGAVLCGVGTAVADDPLLTARFPDAPRTPVRVILDPNLRIPVSSRLVRTARDIPTVVVAGQSADPVRVKNLQSYQVDILTVETDTYGHIPLRNVLAELGRREIISVLVEGGGVTHAAFLAEKLAQRVYWFIAPKLVGGRDAATPVEGIGAERMSEAVQLEQVRVKQIGPDLMVEGTPVFGSSA
jgi:diaminohydroxyphosphoribosylaminopyrimidine deaminase/5-amino-6-(5-phosphoribosylamino)uracil reductase